MEEWPRRGKTLERHDGSSSYYRGPVACSQGLRDPATKLPTVFSPLISASASWSLTSAHIPYSVRLQPWAADNVSSLCSQASLIFPAQSSRDTVLTFHPSQVLIPAWTPHPFVWTKKMSLMSLLALSLYPLHVKLVFFWTALSLSLTLLIIFCLTSDQYLPLATHEYKLPTKNGWNWCSNHLLWLRDRLHSNVHLGVNGVNPCNTSTTYTWCCSEESSSLFLTSSVTVSIPPYPHNAWKIRKTNTGNGRMTGCI